VSVRSSLCPIYRLLLVTVVGLLLGPGMEEIDQQQAPQQHSAQQQMQAVTHCQLMYDLFSWYWLWLLLILLSLSVFTF